MSRGKGRDSKGNTHKGKSKRNKNGKSGKNKGSKSNSGKSPVKGKRDPLKQRLVSRTGRKTVLKPMSTCLKPNAV